MVVQYLFEAFQSFRLVLWHGPIEGLAELAHQVDREKRGVEAKYVELFVGEGKQLTPVIRVLRVGGSGQKGCASQSDGQKEITET